MNTQHTPGPWQVIPREETPECAHAPMMVYDIHSITSDSFPATAVNEKDARLIAAAPELLAALQLAERRACNDLQMWPRADVGSVEFQALKTAHGIYCAAIGAATHQPLPPAIEATILR